MSDFFIVPCAPDYFSYAAIRSLQKVLPEWKLKDALLRSTVNNLLYQMRDVTPKFLGCVLLRYTQRNQAPAKNFKLWINSIAVQIAGKAVGKLAPKPIQIGNQEIPGLIQALRTCNPRMTLSDTAYKKIQLVPDSDSNSVINALKPHHILAHISDFTQLAALSHIHGRPVNGLQSKHLTYDDEKTGQQVQYSGNRLDDMKTRVASFKSLFENLATNVETLAELTTDL